MKLRWFLSGTVRHATDACKHVQKLLDSQRDILSPQAINALTAAIDAMAADLRNNASNDALRARIDEIEKAAAKWSKPYPNVEWRENVEVFLVAIVVAMGIRTFFLQPFKIPTGSMQPTLFGVHGPQFNDYNEDLRDAPDFKMPGPLARIWDAAIYGEVYHQIIAPEDGEVVSVEPQPRRFLHLLNEQNIFVHYVGHDQDTSITLWCGPDDYLVHRAGFDRKTTFQKGQPIVRMEEITGDHLFVDRVTYNFRHPERGEIVVFKTKGIDHLPQDQFYIKRLIGLPGDAVSIGEDRHARINGLRLDASTPHFEDIYSFNPKIPAHESAYSGHVLEDDYRSLLRTPQDSIKVPPAHFIVFGDNTVNSLDSRYWGAFPEQNVIGKSFFVYWPISPRFGWGQQ